MGLPSEKVDYTISFEWHSQPHYINLEDCATTEKMIFIPTLKPLAQGGVRFSDFHAPPCANFRTFL
jgi:hypothetical protein